MAKVTPRSGRRWTKHRGIEPLGDGVRIRNTPSEVRAIRTVRNNAADRGAPLGDVEWRSRLHGHDSGQLPSAQGRLHQSVVTVFQEWKFVDEVDEGNVGSVENGWAIIVSPTQIRIRDSVQIAATSCSRIWIDRL